jgi:hypothetical protein
LDFAWNFWKLKWIVQHHWSYFGKMCCCWCLIERNRWISLHCGLSFFLFLSDYQLCSLGVSDSFWFCMGRLYVKLRTNSFINFTYFFSFLLYFVKTWLIRIMCVKWFWVPFSMKIISKIIPCHISYIVM